MDRHEILQAIFIELKEEHEVQERKPTVYNIPIELCIQYKLYEGVIVLINTTLHIKIWSEIAYSFGIIDITDPNTDIIDEIMQVFICFDKRI